MLKCQYLANCACLYFPYSPYGPTLANNPKAKVIAQMPLMTVGMIVADIPCDKKMTPENTQNKHKKH